MMGLKLLNRTIPSFHNLALFICHLFIDGQFQEGHILFDSAVIDSRLITEIQSNCSRLVPWQITDITQPFSTPWTQNQTTDNILQLIFLDSDHFPEDIDHFNGLFTFYRIFVFQSSNPNDMERQISQIKKSKAIENSNSLILVHNSVSDLMQAFHTLDVNTTDKFDEHHHIQAISEKIYTKRSDLFDFLFGEYEKNYLIRIRYTVNYPCHYACDRAQDIWNANPFLANYYSSKLPVSFINRTHFYFERTGISLEHQVIHNEWRPFYGELDTNYHSVDAKNLEDLTRNRPNVMSLSFYEIASAFQLDGNANSESLYPFHSVKLFVIFVYGSDYQRKINNNLFNKLEIFLLNWTNLVVFLGAVVLCFIRRFSRLRRSGFISVLIDVMIIFIGGGRSRPDHRLERWFFVILSIGAFFLNAICLGPTLFPTYLSPQQSITTFRQLAEVKSEFYFAPYLAANSDIVVEMLRIKLEDDFNYMGWKSISLLKFNEKSFALVVPEPLLEQVLSSLADLRDFDMLEENLGSLQAPYYVNSGHHIPDHFKDKIDRVTSSMTENGLHYFYKELTKYLLNLRTRKLSNADEDGFRALDIEDLKVPLAICLCLLGFATIVFFIEIIIQRFKMRVNF